MKSSRKNKMYVILTMMSLVVDESDVTNANVFNIDIELDFKENTI